MGKMIYLASASVAVAIAIYLLNRNSKEKLSNACYREARELESVDSLFLSNDLTEQNESVIDSIEKSSFAKIYARHEDASITIKSAVETIRDNVKISLENNDEIDAISKEIDKIIGED